VNASALDDIWTSSQQVFSGGFADGGFQDEFVAFGIPQFGRLSIERRRCSLPPRRMIERVTEGLNDEGLDGGL